VPFLSVRLIAAQDVIKEALLPMRSWDILQSSVLESAFFKDLTHADGFDLSSSIMTNA
jgi:hypothetical protein